MKLRAKARLLGLVAAALAAACGQPAPPQHTPTPPINAAPSPDTTSAALRIEGEIQWFGSIGGCAYLVELTGPDGTWKGDLDVVKRRGGFAVSGQSGLPRTLGAGGYSLRLWFVPVSDDRQVGAPPATGPIRATCITGFTVSPGQPSVEIETRFGWDTCAATVTCAAGQLGAVGGTSGAAPAEAVAGAVVPATTASKEDGVVRTGQLLYTPPNADVPESERPNPDHVICPNREPCGP
jgi:hypothetical protein